MGSGLILLVIVGAWLAVLVPMALRSYDASTSTRSVERFGDAMRVLSRRTGRGPDPEREVGAPPPVEPLLHRFRDDPPRPPLTPVARRRRVLLSLLGASVACLLGGLLSAVLLLPGVVLLALAGAYVAHLRRLAVRRTERSVRAAGRPVPRPVPAVAPEPAWPAAPLPVPAARWEDPLPVAAGGEWSPVPVPPPVYVGKPVAPPRAPRVLDLTEPGRWSAAEAGEDRELDDILDGRRAVGGW